MRVRKVDATGDMTFGGNQQSFHRDTPDAVAQVVESRLNLWLGQWYLDLDEGLPVEENILGKYTGNRRDPAIRARILGTPGVYRIDNYSSQFDSNLRSFTVSAKLTTIYSQGYLAGTSTNAGLINIKVENGR